MPTAAQGSDSCASAPGIAGTGQFAFDNTGATGPDADPACGSMAADVWFQWTSQTTGQTEFELCGSNYDSVIAVWLGSGCPIQVLACNDDTCGLQSKVTFPVVTGGTYMIQIGGYQGATGPGMLTITATAPPANDDCSSAQTANGAGAFPFDSTFATTDGMPVSGCSGANGQIDHDVWFLWTSPWADSTTVSTCNLAGFDTQIAVYPLGNCPPANSIACNDDFCGLRSRTVFTSVAGSSYLIRVGSFSGSSGGPGSLEVIEGGPVTGCGSPPAGPDVIVGNLTGMLHWGAVGNVSGYSIGATACNVGDSTMPWEGNTNHHPLIAQHLYRLKNGSFEQLGMSWVKHAFASATENFCCTCLDPGNGQIMGIGCADTYGASTNGVQEGFGAVGGLGPRSEVNPVTGDYPFPYGTQGMSGDAIYKRLQVSNDDLNPALNPGAQYFAEVVYVHPDDAAVGHEDNNASWRPAIIGSFSNGGYTVSLNDVSRPTEPAIFAWREFDPLVTLETVDVPDDGRFIVGSRATDNGNGTWHYEVAVHNYNSARAADSISILLPPGANVSNPAFHGVRHHSGEPYDGQDWNLAITSGQISWTVAAPFPGGQLPEPNALRWGTTFTFKFDVDVPPLDSTLDLDLFGPGTPTAPNRLHVMAQLPDAGCGASVGCSANPNSTGVASLIDYSGTLSVSANDLGLVARDLPQHKFGIFYYGAGEARTPFGNGFQCVSAGGIGLFRLPVVDTGADGLASYTIDNTTPPQAAGQITVGSTWNFQFWYRDPAAGGALFNLSNALKVSFCP